MMDKYEAKCIRECNGYAIYSHTHVNNGFSVFVNGNHKYFWSLEEAIYWAERH